MADLQLVPQPSQLELLPETTPFHAAGTAIVVSGRAEAGEWVAAGTVRAALRRLGIDAPIQPQIRHGAAHGAIVLAVRGRDAEIFGGDLAQGGEPTAGAQALAAGAPPVPRWAGPVEAYTLRSTAQGIELWGASPAGLARGVQTLCQLLACTGGSVPALRIDDRPALAWRGVMLDVSRGRVPRLDTLYQIVDTLAAYKLNMFQLYIEHTFAFRSHPAIGMGHGALTPEEIIALDAYCRERYIELVPCLQSFGHLRGILELPEYAHLAESEERWSLAPVREETYTLLEDLYGDFLACFSSRWINVCSDETYDLGSGQSRARADAAGAGRLYLEHIRRLHALAASYGRTMLVWDDIFLHYPDLIPEIPRDAILLNWWYEDAPHYPQVEGFRQAGLRQVVCPGTSTWNTLFPRLENARGNIRHFVADGLRAGALGVLTTDWGDHSHYNAPGVSWYAYAYSAAESWTPGRLEDADFERRFSTLTFGREGSAALAALRLLHQACTLPGVPRSNGTLTTQLFFEDPLAEDRSVILPEGDAWEELSESRRRELVLRRAGCTQIPGESLARMATLASEALDLLASLRGESEEATRTLQEFRLAAREIAHAAAKGRLARQVAGAVDPGDRHTLSLSLLALKQELHDLRAEHQRLWLRRSKPEGLWRSLDRFDRSAALIDAWRAQVAPSYRWGT